LAYDQFVAVQFFEVYLDIETPTDDQPVATTFFENRSPVIE